MSDPKIVISAKDEATPVVDKVQQKFTTFAGSVESDAAKVENATKTVSGGIGDIAGRLAGFVGIAGGIAGVGVLADQFASLQARIGIASQGLGVASEAYRTLFRVAQETHAPVAGLADVFVKLAVAGKELGVSQDRLLGVTRTISQAMALSGGSADSMRAAIIQLGQGLASGTLRGEELNSVMEQTPRLAKAIADGMGITIGQLRAFGKEGKITAEQIISALESVRGQIDKEFKQLPLTIGGAVTLVQNAFLDMIGSMDKATGASSLVAAALKLVAENIGVVAVAAGALIATGIAAFLATQLPAAIAATTAALTFMTGPIGLLVGGVSALVGGLALLWASYREGQTNVEVARGELRKMEEQLAKQPNNLMLKTYIKDQRELVAQLELGVEAERNKAGVMREARGWMGLRLQDENALAKAEEFRLELARKNAGQDKDFVDNLKKLNEAYRLGVIPSTEEYARQVELLIDREGGGKKITQEYNEEKRKQKEATKAVTEATKTADAELAKSLGVNRDYVEKLKELEFWYSKNRDRTDDYVRMIQKLIAEQPSTIKLTKDQAEAIKKMEKAIEDANAEMDRHVKKQKEEGDEYDKLKGKIEDETAALGASKATREEVELQRYRMKLAALDEKIAVQQLWNEGYGPFFDELVKSRDKMLGVVKAQKELVDKSAAIESAKAAKEEWKSTAEAIEKALTDSLVAGFEGGKSILKSIGDYIVNFFKTSIASGIAKALTGAIMAGLSAVAQAAGSALSGSSGGGAAGGAAGSGGGSILSSILSGAGGGFSGGMVGGVAGLFTDLGLGGTLSNAGWLLANGQMGAGLGMGLGAIAPYAIAAYGLYRLISGKGTGRDRSPALQNYSVLTGAGTPGANNYFPTPNLQSSSAYDDVLRNLVGTVALTAAAFGGKANAATQYGMFSSVSPDGKGGQTVGVVSSGAGFQFNRNVNGDNATVEQRLDEMLPNMLLAGLQTADLPKRIAEYFNSVSADSVSKETVDAMIAAASAAHQMATATALLGPTFAQLGDLSVQARSGILGLTGGLDAFLSKVSAYVSSFYTEEEQAGISATNVAAVLTAAGIDINGLDTKEEFRAIVDSLDLSTEKGQQQLAALLNVAGQFASLTDFMKENGKDLSTLAKGVTGVAAAVVAQNAAAAEDAIAAEEEQAKRDEEQSAANVAAVTTAEATAQTVEVVTRQTEILQTLANAVEVLSQATRAGMSDVASTTAAGASAVVSAVASLADRPIAVTVTVPEVNGGTP